MSFNEVQRDSSGLDDELNRSNISRGTVVYQVVLTTKLNEYCISSMICISCEKAANVMVAPN